MNQKIVKKMMERAIQKSRNKPEMFKKQGIKKVQFKLLSP